MALHDTFEDLDAEVLAAEPLAREIGEMFKRKKIEPTTRFGIALIRLGCMICVSNGISATALVQPLVAGVPIPKNQKVM